MPFWDENSGDLELTEDVRLCSHMSLDALLALFPRLTDAPPVLDRQQADPIVPLPAFAVPGGQLAAVCYFHGQLLHAVELSVLSVGAKKRGSADQQRALLFQCMRAQDPARDSKRGALLRCPCGAVLIATDPRTGDATLRLTYR